jgi:exodeoxyribonuclease-5
MNDTVQKQDSISLPPQIVLTPEQEHAVNYICSVWFTNPNADQIFTLGGYAGTGKTTVIKEIRKRIDDIVKQSDSFDIEYETPTEITAFTGKAVSVLRRKGLWQAKTLHSLLYTVEVDEKTKKPIFTRRYRLEPAPRLIIVDEASMISSELFADLKHFGVKLLFVGDPGQLEPVGDNPNLMKNPKIVLSKIHRQAAESPILQLAHSVRNGGRINYGSRPGLSIIQKQDLAQAPIDSDTQFICAYNKQRINLNSMIRSQLGRGLNKLVEGEKLICLQNNRTHGVFNGQILFVEEIGEVKGSQIYCTLRDELDTIYTGIPVFDRGFNGEFDPKKDKLPTPDTCLFDYGYCITGHKSQGSEWERVCVLEQYSPLWDMNRWRYTVITRASKELIYVR